MDGSFCAPGVHALDRCVYKFFSATFSEVRRILAYSDGSQSLVIGVFDVSWIHRSLPHSVFRFLRHLVPITLIGFNVSYSDISHREK